MVNLHPLLNFEKFQSLFLQNKISVPFSFSFPPGPQADFWYSLYHLALFLVFSLINLSLFFSLHNFYRSVFKFTDAPIITYSELLNVLGLEFLTFNFRISIWFFFLFFVALISLLRFPICLHIISMFSCIILRIDINATLKRLPLIPTFMSSHDQFL